MREIVRQRILKKYNHKCANCGSTENLQVDHIIPLSKGGPHNEDNMQILCRKCNYAKGSKLPHDKYLKVTEEGDVLVKKSYMLFLSHSENFNDFMDFVEKCFTQPEHYHRVYPPNDNENITVHIRK